MPDGYIGKKPDVSWWMSQIEAGRTFRDKWAMKSKWEVWQKYYRGNWRAGTLPVNMFFSIMRSVVPRIYFRDPAVSVTPAQGGYLAMAFAQLVGRIDNTLIAQMAVKREMKRMVQAGWMKGTAFGKLGFGTVYGISGSDPDAPRLPGDERLEYGYNVSPGFPWFKFIDTGNIVLPAELKSFEDGRWWAHELQRPRDDLLRDPRLKNVDKAATSIYSVTTGAMDATKRIEMIDLLEVHDRKFNTVFLLAPNSSEGSQILIMPQDDKMGARRPNLFKLGFNPDNDNVWDVPDACILEPSQLELNEVNTLIMKHRRISLIKIMYEKGAITEEQMSKLLSEDVGAGVEINEGFTGKVTPIAAGTIPQELIQAKQLVVQDIRDQMGFSRNQMGEYQSRRGDTSATEAAIVQQASEIRIDERRDAIADVLVELMEEVQATIFTRWTEMQVLQVVGPGGVPVWVQARPSMLALSRYKLRVDPDSGVHRERQQREQRAIALYQLLKTNPIIDPFKLTQYLLTEIEGVEMDDLMRVMPQVPGFNPGNTLNPQGYGQLLQAGFQGLAAAGPQLPAQTPQGTS